MSLIAVSSACGGGGGGGSGVGLDDLDGDGAVRVLAFGDSITRGVGDGPDEDSRPSLAAAGYPARLQQLLGVAVINAGNAGERASDGLDRLPNVLDSNPVDYVILLEGVNDLPQRSSIEIAADLEAMVEEVIAYGAQPLIATLPPTCCEHSDTQPDSAVRTLNNLIRNFALNHLPEPIPVIDFFAAFVPDPQGLQVPFNPATGTIHVEEGLHPTPLGYDLMALAAADVF